MAGNLTKNLSKITLRLFQFLAYAEGGLLPSILLIAVYHWITGRASVLVAIIGASHGMVFTAYIFIVPLVARIFKWSWRTTSIAWSVAFVPFATWNFERKIHGDLMKKFE